MIEITNECEDCEEGNKLVEKIIRKAITRGIIHAALIIGLLYVVYQDAIHGFYFWGFVSFVMSFLLY